MAATWMKSLHFNKGKTVAQTLADRTDYAENHEKTDGGQLVTGYACNPPAAGKKSLYAGFKEAKEASKPLTIALGNANHILGITPDTKSRDASHETP